MMAGEEMAGMNAGDPKLRIKTTPPGMRRNFLQRARLSLASAPYSDCQTIMVRAGGGFGKTSLLSQWRAECLGKGERVGWLALDQGDDPLSFAHGLNHCLGSGDGRAQKIVPEGLGDCSDGIEALTVLIGAIIDSPGRTALILDDLHALPRETLTTSIPYLIQNAPPNLRLLLGSRNYFKSTSSSLLKRGDFALIGEDDLRFSEQETLEIFRSRPEMKADREEAARIHALSEGWPLGLDIALVAIAAAPNRGELLSRLSIGSEDIALHLLESLSASLSDYDLAMLCRLSVFDVIRPDLVNSVFPDPHALDRLEALYQTSSLLTKADGADWLSLHFLVRQHLQKRYLKLPLEERRAFSLAAANWYAEQGLFGDAVDHAFAADRPDLAGRFAESCLFELVAQGRIVRAMNCVAGLARADVETRPALRIAAAWTHALCRDLVRARELSELIAGQPDATETERIEARLIDATIAQMADDRAGSVAILSSLDGVAAIGTGFQMQVLSLLRAMAMLDRGEPAEARQTLFLAKRAAGKAISAFLSNLMEWVIGCSYLREGRYADAEMHLNAHLQKAEEKWGRRNNMAVILAGHLAYALLEQGKTEQAKSVLGDRLDALEKFGMAEPLIVAYLALYFSEIASGRPEQGIRYLWALRDNGINLRMPRLVLRACYEEIRFHALQQDAVGARRAHAELESLQPGMDGESTDYLVSFDQLYLELGHAFYHQACERYDAALRHFQRAGSIAARLRRLKEANEIALFEEIVSRQLDAARAVGSVRIRFTRFTFSTQTLIRRARPGLRKLCEDAGLDWCAEAGEQFSWPSSSPPLSFQEPFGPGGEGRLLTRKETDILLLLRSGAVNKQIARTLGISLETVKWHLKNIYGKLNVSGRKHAISQGQRLGLFEGQAPQWERTAPLQ
ncbi:serine/threonine-protein kinase PknK [mine drainage metagenome]|uniref:Serine/threonine-protein kinase PknK n=1 Tax=mine drainage metagenome TaxID=410659 RepID=A0A1J5R170_9ZZZZ